ncbi:CLUMA_CG018416, isoform A [Clunio marinus]|uniref:CLUMA_CG018416, isoform A n=1 Tax=Clunio marinus TaxID=568069 RepID=A0A1J1IZN5_9DIPT|nr:CLUMA_CG018416, isoform A [Clunio marinus]
MKRTIFFSKKYLKEKLRKLKLQVEIFSQLLLTVKIFDRRLETSLFDVTVRNGMTKSFFEKANGLRFLRKLRKI